MRAKIGLRSDGKTRLPVAGMMALLCGVTAAAPGGGPQTDFTWTGANPGGGAFNSPLNWDPFVIFGPNPVVGPPGPGEMATFDLGNAAYTVTFASSPTNRRFRLGDDAVTFDLGGQTYTLTSTTDTSIALGYGFGAGDQCALTLTNGVVNGQDADIAAIGGMAGAQLVVGSSAGLFLAGTLSVGTRDTGSLTIMSAGDVGCDEAVLGELFVSNPIPSTGNGTATVTGLGSTWTIVDSLTVAGVGDGTLNIQNGGHIMPACIACPDRLDLMIGASAGADGVINISGVGSDLTVTGSMIAGNAGTAQINISAGGTLHTNAATTPNGQFGDKIGFGTGATGTMTITGAGSGWFSDEPVTIGGDPITPLSGGMGTGHLNILNGATADTGSVITGAAIARSLGSTGFVTVSGAGSLWNAGGTLTVGSLGAAEMTIDGSADVIAEQVFIASNTQSSGELTVDGTGSTLTTPVTFVVGGGVANIGGSALLTISNGASVVHQNAGVDFVVWPVGAVVLNNGSLTAPSVALHGSLEGHGTVHGDVDCDGVISPDGPTPPGVITINGDFTQQDLGTLEIEIGGVTPGTQHDQIIVSGDVALAGMLDLSIINSFFPQPGDQFTIIRSTGGAVSGAFDTMVSPLAFDLIYQADRVIVAVPVCPADVDNSGEVDVDDLIAVILGWGGCANCTTCAADTNNDCAVDVDDLIAVILGWGACS